MIEISYLELVIFISVVWVALRTLFAIKNKQVNLKRECLLLTVYICIVVISRMVYFPLHHVDGHIDYLRFDAEKILPLWMNFHPFTFVYERYDGWQINIIGNITMFIPVGICWGLCFKKLNNVLKVTLAGFGYSLVIELSQLFLYERGSDIDDLILNTTGAFIGALIYFGVASLMGRNKSAEEPLFYNEYEQFYGMAGKSKAFEKFCREAFGDDFSQDGFSDLNQINRILKYVPEGEDIHILDIGCGNGKMLGYLQKKTGAHIHGFDYSENAINTANRLFQTKADFRQGKMGEIDYPTEKFDLITSMDTMYFAPDMEKFVLQIMKWLKKNGVLFVGYQEGDVMPKTENFKTTVFARALDKSGIKYEVEDITKETYDLLKKKREAALLYQKDFEEEGNKEWFDLLMMQTDCTMEPYETFAKEMARYIYVVRRGN